MAVHDQHPAVSGEANPVDSGDASAVEARGEPDTRLLARYRRLRDWTVANPEKAGSLFLGFGALATAAVSAIVAIVSLNVAVQALHDQTASDQANRDIQIRSFASKVSLVSGSPGGGPPAELIMENLNNEPLAPSAIVFGASADAQVSSDGFTYMTTFSWRKFYSIDGMGPCSQYTLTLKGYSPGDIGKYSGLVFFDNNNVAWYRTAGGLLVQLLLGPAEESNLRSKTADAPPYSQADYGYRTFTGCS